MNEPLLRVGVDASPLGPGRTGVGNYVSRLLQAMCEQNPQVEFTLFGNTSVNFTTHGQYTDSKASMSPGNAKLASLTLANHSSPPFKGTLH